MTTLTTSFPSAARTYGKRALRGLLGFLALFMTATLFTGCGKGRTEYEKGVASLEKGD